MLFGGGRLVPVFLGAMGHLKIAPFQGKLFCMSIFGGASTFAFRFQIPFTFLVDTHIGGGMDISALLKFSYFCDFSVWFFFRYYFGWLARFFKAVLN